MVTEATAETKRGWIFPSSTCGFHNLRLSKRKKQVI